MTEPAASTASVLSLIADDMLEVDAVIAERLDSGVALVGQVSRYIISAGGKRLRPALLLLVSAALGCKGPQRFNLAAVVEFIHTATLLHDDVVDESTLRRGRATANESFGNPASVLVGDFLYSRAFQMMLDADDMRVMAILADATNVIAEGEVLQLMNMHDAALDEAGYLRVIRSKTAKLFEASARLGAVLAGAPAALEEALRGLRAGAGHRLPGDRRRARLRRRRPRDGQEPRRRPARGQDHAAADRRHAAGHAAATRPDPACHRERRPPANWRRSSPWCARPAPWRSRAPPPPPRRSARSHARSGLPRNAYSEGLVQLAAQLLERRN